MFRFHLWLLLTALLSVTALACGDNDGAGQADSGALRDYFGAYEKISDDVNGRIRALDEQYPDAFEGDVEQTKTLYAEYVSLFNEFLDRFGELEPPDQVADLHERTLAANRALNAINEDRLDQLDDAATASEVDSIFAEDPDFTDAVAEKDELCLEAEERAASYDIEITLAC